MSVIELQERTPKGTTAARAVRKQSQVPGVLYGDHIENRYFAIDTREVDKLKKSNEASGLLDVQIAGESESVKAILQHVQQDSVTGNYEHIDLYQVRMDRKLHTEIPLEFVGESGAVKDLGGILVKQHNELPIECLPSDLVNHIEVPISVLNTFEDVIRVKDIELPKGISTSLAESEIIAAVSEPRSEEELEAELAAEITEGEGPEVLTEKKDDEAGEVSAESGADETAPKEKAEASENKEDK